LMEPVPKKLDAASARAYQKSRTSITSRNSDGNSFRIKWLLINFMRVSRSFAEDTETLKGLIAEKLIA
jgi:hypothetical protein